MGKTGAKNLDLKSNCQKFINHCIRYNSKC